MAKDMGLTGNYTYVNSQFEYDFSGNMVTERLTGLSTHSVNATLYYDDDTFSLRGSLAWRSQFINHTSANRSGNLFQLNEPEPRFDMSSSYKITENLQLNLEALNVTDAAAVNTVVDVDARRHLTYSKSGRTIFLGARATL